MVMLVLGEDQDVVEINKYKPVHVSEHVAARVQKPKDKRWLFFTVMSFRP